MKKRELIERDPEELMREAASDELFLSDLNETMEGFGHADQEEHEILTMDCLANLDPSHHTWRTSHENRPYKDPRRAR